MIFHWVSPPASSSLPTHLNLQRTQVVVSNNIQPGRACGSSSFLIDPSTIGLVPPSFCPSLQLAQVGHTKHSPPQPAHQISDILLSHSPLCLVPLMQQPTHYSIFPAWCMPLINTINLHCNCKSHEICPQFLSPHFPSLPQMFFFAQDCAIANSSMSTQVTRCPSHVTLFIPTQIASCFYN